MAGITVEEFVNKIGFQVDQTQLAAAENTVNKAVNGMASGFSWLVKSMAPLAAGFGLFEIGKYAITSAANVERLTAQFEVMLGGADKATKMVKDIQTLAAATPLTSVGVTESVKTLLAFGVAGKDAISTIKMLGDVAGGDQERLNRLSYAYGQTMTAGRLMGQDLLQYINVGFSPLKVIGDNLATFGLKVGTTQNDLRDMMSKGKISADMVTKAFQIATSEGGMFYQNMEKQSKTLGGLWSTMIDNIQLGLIKAITPLIPLMKQIVDFAGQIDWTPMVQGLQLIADVLLTLYNNFSLVYPIIIGIFGAKATAMFVANMGKMALAGRTLGVTLATAFASILTPINIAMVAIVGLWVLVNKLKADTKSDFQKMEDAANESDVVSGSAKFKEMLANKELMVANKELAAGRASADSGRWVDPEAMKKNLKRKKDAEEILANIKAARSRVYGEENSLIPTELINATKNTKQQTINVNNDITNHVTVDDKGKTPLSVDAVKALVDTNIRSAFNIEFIQLARGV